MQAKGKTTQEYIDAMTNEEGMRKLRESAVEQIKSDKSASILKKIEDKIPNALPILKRFIRWMITTYVAITFSRIAKRNCDEHTILRTHLTQPRVEKSLIMS